jgi:hypothetical protein
MELAIFTLMEVSEICVSRIERRGRVVNTPASYSRGPGFKYCPGDRLFCPKAFVLSLSLLTKMSGKSRHICHHFVVHCDLTCRYVTPVVDVA